MGVAVIKVNVMNDFAYELYSLTHRFYAKVKSEFKIMESDLWKAYSDISRCIDNINRYIRSLEKKIREAEAEIHRLSHPPEGQQPDSSAIASLESAVRDANHAIYIANNDLCECNSYNHQLKMETDKVKELGWQINNAERQLENDIETLKREVKNAASCASSICYAQAFMPSVSENAGHSVDSGKLSDYIAAIDKFLKKIEGGSNKSVKKFNDLKNSNSWNDSVSAEFGEKLNDMGKATNGSVSCLKTLRGSLYELLSAVQKYLNYS